MPKRIAVAATPRRGPTQSSPLTRSVKKVAFAFPGIGLGEHDGTTALAFGHDDEHAVRFVDAGEIVEVGARTETVVRVVGADFFVSGRYDEHVAGKLLRDRLPAGRKAFATGKVGIGPSGSAHDWVMNASNSSGVPLSWLTVRGGSYIFTCCFFSTKKRKARPRQPRGRS